MYKVAPITVYPKTVAERQSILKAAKDDNRSASSYLINLHKTKGDSNEAK